MTLRIFVFLLAIASLCSCSSTKKQAELIEQTKPNWLKERPVNNNYYFGIGIVPKVGAAMLYEDKAKERALADISGQINSSIKSEAVLYQVEDKHGVREYLQNRIRSTSSEYLEGYEYIEKWEDLSNVYVYYRLSKQKYIEAKERRKNEAISTATEKYKVALRLEKEQSFVAAIEHYAFCIDILSGYLNESTSTTLNNSNVDLVAESTVKIETIIKNIQVKYTEKNNPKNHSEISNNFFMVLYQGNGPVFNLPVVFEYSGGYLTTDKVKSNDKGIVLMPELPKDNNVQQQTLAMSIDLVNLGRQVTKNLFVRKIIENQKAAKTSTTVN